MPKSIMASVANSNLVFRILALLFLTASIVIMATNNFKRSDFEISFTDLNTYRYVLAVAAIGVVYALIQIPFAIYYACTEERLIEHECLPGFDLYADKVIGFLLATGVGAGFAVTYELKGNEFYNFLEAAQGLEGVDISESDTTNFLNRGYIASGFLFLGFLCMAVLSVVSSIAQAMPAKDSSSFWDSFTSFFTFPTWTLFSEE